MHKCTKKHAIRKVRSIKRKISLTTTQKKDDFSQIPHDNSSQIRISENKNKEIYHGRISLISNKITSNAIHGNSKTSRNKQGTGKHYLSPRTRGKSDITLFEQIHHDQS